MAQKFNGTSNVPLTVTDILDLWASLEGSVTITGSTTLTFATHVCRILEVNSALALTLTLPNDAGIPAMAFIRGVNLGAGAISFAGTGIVSNAILPATVDQYSAFELRRIPNGWIRVA